MTAEAITPRHTRSSNRCSPETIATLVAAATTGDQPAWNALVQEYTALLWSIARTHRLDASDAADVVQTTWVRLLEHITRLNDPTRVGDWLATTARRECLRLCREQKRTQPFADDTPEPQSADPPFVDTLITHERDQALRHAFAGLQPRDQALLRLLMAEPRPAYDEISAALDIPIGSIGPTRQRALQRLRQQLGKHDSLELLMV